MNRRLNALAAVAASAAVSAAVLVAVPAQATSVGVIRTGSCSGSTDWKLKAKPDDGRLEVEWEVDSNRVGQTWTWTIRHDGVLKASGTRTTLAPSGSFSVERRIADAAGVHRITGYAKNAATGEICRGSVWI